MTTIKQKFCNHHWFTVENMTAANVVIEFIKSHSAIDFPYSLGDISYVSSYPNGHVLYDKVCLKCKLVKAELSNFRRKLEAMDNGEFDKAKNTARRILENTAEQAIKYNERKKEAQLILKEYLNGQKN